MYSRVAIFSRYRATQGKGNEQFIHNLQDLLRTACSMMSKDCPEGELVAPKAVSYNFNN